MTVNSVNTYIVPTVNNEVTMPSQPAFLAYNSVTDADVTGAGANYTVIFDTEVFDQNADYNNATGTFTSPVTARYQFDAQLFLQQVGGATLTELYFNASNREWRIIDGFSESMHNGALVDMDAADTITVSVLVNGVGGNTSDVLGGASAITSFGGFLAI